VHDDDGFSGWVDDDEVPVDPFDLEEDDEVERQEAIRFWVDMELGARRSEVATHRELWSMLGGPGSSAIQLDLPENMPQLGVRNIRVCVGHWGADSERFGELLATRAAQSAFPASDWWRPESDFWKLER
jgi:hypothetical protein